MKCHNGEGNLCPQLFGFPYFRLDDFIIASREALTNLRHERQSLNVTQACWSGLRISSYGTKEKESTGRAEKADNKQLEDTGNFLCHSY